MKQEQNKKVDNLKQLSEKLAKDVNVIRDIMSSLNIPTTNNSNVDKNKRD